MKRSNTSRTDETRQKSARIGELETKSPPDLPPPRVPPRILSQHDLLPKSYYDTYHTYDHVAPFVRSNPDVSASTRAYRHGADVMRTVREIEEQVESMLNQIHEKCDQLRSHTQDFMKASFEPPGAYEHGDLLGKAHLLPDSTRFQMLKMRSSFDRARSAACVGVHQDQR